MAYWVANKHPAGSGAGIIDSKRIPVFGDSTGRKNILQLVDPERVEQRRGVPILAPVIESLKQLGRYSDAELMAAVVSGFFTVFIKSAAPDPSGLGEGIPEDQRVDTADSTTTELGNGSIVELDPGDEIQAANPTRPNPNFDGFVLSICRQVGAALELPYELLVKNFTASYSASRGALLEAWKMFRCRRSWLATSFCQPIYEEFLTEAVARGYLDAPGFFDDPMVRWAYCRAEWNGPSQGQLNPLLEVKAAKTRVEEGFSTRARETAELTGGDFEANNAQRGQEEQMRKDAGLTVDVIPAGEEV
jgi:lambda family phage portal protein